MSFNINENESQVVFYLLQSKIYHDVTMVFLICILLEYIPTKTPCKSKKNIVKYYTELCHKKNVKNITNILIWTYY